jgi:hypothetical protein
MFVRLIILSLISLIIAAACGPALNCGAANNMQQQPSVGKQMPAQIIIKFRNDARDPSKPYFVRELALSAGATLVYVRPMSGRAHVFRVEDITGEGQLTEVIERLSKRPDVQCVEPDNLLYYQDGK